MRRYLFSFGIFISGAIIHLDMPKKKEGKTVSVWFSKYYVDKMEEIADSGKYNSRSEIVREAVRDWFDMRKQKVGEVERNFKK